MRSKFAVRGHPLHPALVAVPVGLFVWALVADIVYIARGRDDQLWYDISYWAAIGGIVSALIAALPGFGDFMTLAVDSDARDIALTHMLLNLAMIAIFAVATALMYDHGATDGGRLTAVVALHAFGNGLLMLAGWLGGEMVYRHHLSVIPGDPDLERDEHARHDVRRPVGRTLFRNR